MPERNLPEDVVKTLSFHGPVEIHSESPNGMISARAEVAPFDTHLVAFLRPHSPIAEALLRTGRAEVHARHPDGNYTLRLVGAAHPGIPSGRRADRAMLEPWFPERGGHGLLAAEIIPFHIEYTRQEAGTPVRYHGPTPAGRRDRGRLAGVVRVGFSAGGLIGAMASFPVVFGYLAWAGPEVPWRPVALVFGILGGVLGAAGLRLLLLSSAYALWQRSRGTPAECAPITSGQVSYGDARYAGVWLLGLWIVSMLVALGVWSQGLAAAILLGSLVPFQAVGGLLHQGSTRADH